MKRFAIFAILFLAAAGNAIGQMSADPMNLYGGYRETPARLFYGASYYGGYGVPRLYSYSGEFRGTLDPNVYSPHSVWNEYGRYGNPYSPHSLRNPYGAGNPYSGGGVYVVPGY